MKNFIKSAVLALACMAMSGLSAQAQGTVSAQVGDLVLGFRASSAPGNDKNLTVNLGDASKFYNAAPKDTPEAQLQLGNLNAELTAVYGDDWPNRPDLKWGVIGTNGQTAGNGKAARTLWATKSASALGSSTPWTRFGSQLHGTAVSVISPIFSGTATILGSLNGAPALGSTGLSGSAASINNTLAGSFSKQDDSTQGLSFNFFSPTITTTLGVGLQVTRGDLYEVQPSSVGGSAARLGQFVLLDSGSVVFISLNAPATKLNVNVPNSVTALSTFSVAVQATDENGNLDQTNNSTVTLSVSGTTVGTGTLVNGAATLTGTAPAKAGTVTLNASNGSVNGSASLKVVGGAATKLSLSAVSPVTSGSNVRVTVLALDAGDNVDPSTTGTVTLSTGGTTLGTAALVSGSATFSGTIPLTVAGSVSLSATANGLTAATASTTVVAAPATKLTISAPSSVTAGGIVSAVVLAQDAFGNLDTNATTSVILAFGGSNIGSGALVSGSATIVSNITALQTATTGILSVSGDALTSATTGLTVNPAAASVATFVSEFPLVVTAGNPLNATINARDAFGNLATNFNGTVTVSYLGISDTVTLANGVASFTSSALTAAGSTTFNVALGLTSSEIPIPVSPAAASKLAITGDSTVTAGGTLNVIITAQDTFGNTVTNSNASVTISGEGKTLGAVNLASGVFNGTATGLTKAGVATVTAASGSLTNGTYNTTVTAATASKLKLSVPGAVVSGSTFAVTVTAEDTFDNLANSTVAVSVAEEGVQVYGGATLVSGSATFTTNIGITKLGSITLTASGGSLTPGTASTNVVSALATKLLVSAPASVVSGSNFTVTVTAVDNNNVLGSTSATTVSLASGGTTLATGVTFTGGSATFTTTTPLTAAGSANLVATASTLSGSTTTTVTPGAATKLSLTAPAQVVSGSNFSVTVLAQDANNNVNASVTGAVTLKSGTVTLGSSTLASGSATFTTTTAITAVGTVTLSATTDTLSGTASTSVIAGAATKLRVTAPGTVTSGSNFSVTVVAQDANNNTADTATGSVTVSVSGTTIGTSTLTTGSTTFVTTTPVTTAGTFFVTANGASVTGSTSVTFTPATASQLVFSLPSAVVTSGSFVVGRELTVTVTQRDTFGNSTTLPAGSAIAITTSTTADAPALVTAQGATSVSFNVTPKALGSLVISGSLVGSNPAVTASASTVIFSDIELTAVNDPVYSSGTASVVVPVLKNDTTSNDAFGIAVSAVGTIASGSTGFSSVDGTVTFKPTKALTTSGSFSYTITNTLGQTATAFVTVRPAISGTADFVGAYDGVIMVDPAEDVPTFSNEGYVFLNVATPTVSRTGTTASLAGSRVVIGGVTYSAAKTAAFTAGGTFSGKFGGATLNLTLDPSPSSSDSESDLDSSIYGTIKIGKVTWPIEVKRKIATVAEEVVGTYNVVLEQPSKSKALPQGTGFARMNIATSGTVVITGTLADGAAFRSTTLLKKDGTIPFFASGAPLTRGTAAISYVAGGALVGEFILDDEFEIASDANAQVDWFRPAAAKNAITAYRTAFSASLDALASKYTAPATGETALDVSSSTPNVTITFSAGNIKDVVIGRTKRIGSYSQGLGYTATATTQVATPERTLVSNNAVPVTTTNAVTSITIDPATGIFTGSYVSPVTRNATTFSGILFQDGNYGLGYFLGTVGSVTTGSGRGASGAVKISVIEKN